MYARRDDVMVGVAGLLILAFWAAVLWRMLS
jgi:hypothetical protein